MAPDDAERTSDGRRSLPGKLTALLEELAHVPEGDIGAGWDRLPAPGAVVGRFELVRELGRGGFGVVYEARDRELGRSVAFKLVLPGKDLAAREERLFREAEAAARLAHPNIVTLHDVGRGELGPYLVLELLHGRTLAERLAEGPVPVAEALRIAGEVAKGVAHAHGHGIVHRDLSPRNVFLGDDGQVKVLDLGMAHAFGHRRVGGGTSGYMAPEQRRGAPEDERTDVFALGAMLHRMLSGSPPFREDGGAAGPAPRLEVPGAPELGDLVARMLEEDPVRRPRDAVALIAPLTSSLRELETGPASGPVGVVRRRRSARWVVGALAAALVGLAAAWGAHRILGQPATAPDASIAVLPFEDLSPERDQEHFAEGLAEAILVALARVDGLRVPGRTSSFYFKGKDARLADIGRELNVGAVLEGTVRRAGNRVRVTAQVVNVADGYRRWARTYDRELTDLLTVQDEIARAVVDALDVNLLAGNAPEGASQLTRDPQAYAQYLVGRQQYNLLTREGFRASVEAYERALAIDPDYAAAWAGLAIPLFFTAPLADTPAAAAATRRRALEAAAKAVELAPDLAEALSARGILRAHVDHDWPGAKTDLERAIALNPHDPDTRRRHATVLYNLGRLPEAITEIKKALDLDPLGPSWNTLGAFHQEAGELEAADAAFRRHLKLAPGTLAGLWGLARNLLLQRRPEEALALFEGRPEEDYSLWVKAIAAHQQGNTVASDAALAALVAKHGPASAVGIAEVHAWRGEKDAAFEWLERAPAEPSIQRNAFLSSLHGDPRWAALLERMKLPAR